MRVTFVHISHGATVSYSHGIAALAGALKNSRENFETSLVSTSEYEPHTTAERIIAQAPDIVCFSLLSNQWSHGRDVVRELRALDRKLPIGIGGTHVDATAARDNFSEFDFHVVGEADLEIAQILTRVGQGSRGRFDVSPPTDLDSTPYPDVSIFPLEDILSYPSVMFSRGCPFHCTYCMSRLGGFAGSVRWKSPERALAEVKDLILASNAPEIYFDDDTLLKNPRWVKSFLPAYNTEIGRPYYCNARPETVRNELTTLLRETGCAGVGIGIESGSERLRAEVLGRPMSDERIRDAFSAAHQAGLRTWSFNMVGIPGETAEDVAALISLNEQCDVGDVRISVFTPFPGSPLGDINPSLNPSYFRSWTDLAIEKQRLIHTWMTKLHAEGRLWYTDSEWASMRQNLEGTPK